MDCRACGAAIQPGARFCAACGTPVERSCARCGAELPPDARFCPSCGTPTEVSAEGRLDTLAGSSIESTEPVRERKVASILFADLVGFTALGETHDPELVGATVARVFDRLRQEVERYQGTVEKFAGDAMLAVFGVPAVHEDDAERAVRSALEMQAAMGELEPRDAGPSTLAIRIGVETGEVLANLGRATQERDLFVTGDAVNTAARLQQAAAPATVVVGPATYAATRDVIDYEELPAAILKGKSLPTAAWRAVSVKARRGGRRAPLGIEAPIVGRDEELGLLKETIRRAVAESRPHLVTVLGAAGVGKSRLLWELEKYLDGLPEAYHWRKGRCLAYAQTSYSALADVVKADAQIRDDLAPTVAADALDARLGELAIGGAEGNAIREALRAVLALGPVPAWPREDLFDAWQRYLEAIAKVAPLILVVEDIHWADDGLLDFLEGLARWANGQLVIVCLARHELHERRPAWGGGIPNAATIVLEPLDPAESARLVDGLLGGSLPPTLAERIVSFAEGNPLFTEELVRMFVDRGVLRFSDGRWEPAAPIEDIEVPGSVQAVLAARLDGLPPPEKRLAQHASVVGRIFWDAVVAHVSRQGSATTKELLRNLRVKELVVPREPSAFAGAAEFGFRHVLIRDVAYESLPKRERAELHREVADWAEKTLGERRDEVTELLAAHYLAALRYEEEFAAPSDGLRPLREATYRYARAAGRRAAELYQLQIASGWYAVAVEQARRLGLDPRERAAIAEEYFNGSTGHVPADVGLPVVEDAIRLLEALPEQSTDDEELLGRLRAAAAFHLYNLARVEEARAQLRTGIAALVDRPASHARPWLLERLGWTFWRGGPVEEAAPLLRRAVDEARAIGDRKVEAWGLHDLAVATGMIGDAGRSLELMLESFDLARAIGDRTLESRCYNNVPSVMWTNGALIDEVRPILEEGIARHRRSGDLGALSWNAQSLADMLWEAGFLDDVQPYYAEASAAAAAIGDEAKVAIQDLSLAWADFQRRRDPESIARYEAAYARAAGADEPQSEIFPELWTAELTFLDQPAAAVRRLRAAVESATAWATRLDGGRLLARMALRNRDRDSLELGIAGALGLCETATGPRRALDARWMRALARADAESVDELAEVAAAMEAAQAPLPAADVFADAALIAARLGHRAAKRLVGEARRLYEACGVIPAFGWPPETRWIVPSAEAVAATE